MKVSIDGLLYALNNLDQYTNCEYIEMSENIAKLATIISDYEGLPEHIKEAVGEQHFTLLCEHIIKWLSQFDEHDKDFVLQHTVNLMSRNYYSKNEYATKIENLIDENAIERFFRKGCCLSIQRNGNSQSNINSFINEVIERKANFKMPIYDDRELVSANITLYENIFYFDDFSFSGNRIKQDIETFLDNIPVDTIQGKNLIISPLLVHSYFWSKIRNDLELIINNKRLNINLAFIVDKCLWGNINNSFMHYTNLSQVYFLEENIVEMPRQFLFAKQYAPEYFRKGNSENCILGNDIDRRRIEKIFTEKGFYILSHSNNPSSVIKPLGYSGFNGFGFGGNVFSYRNCPNNTPLVFWWGNYEKNDGTALGCWYPLMARTTY